ncbi:phage portal family protein [Mucilaginibacter kameinonensis]|uniref:hypothetical protein n=1 Tax=Mucilaginibacter kameinonensis TaxID=452286 RepID=UPI000EF7B4C6|nr:hypothetical protein [Mucilaginibacter kameinonensis]
MSNDLVQVDDNKFRTAIINFSRSITPLPENFRQGTTDDNYVRYGDDNLYPNFLLRLLASVPLHRSIALSKANYILGDGIVVKDTGKPADFDINLVDSFEEVIRKCVQDYIIFNTFVLEIQYDVLKNKPLYFNHIPANQMRCNFPKTKFWICPDWKQKRSVLSYDRWIKGNNPDQKSKIFMFQGYVPSAQNTYAEVSYQPAVTSMVSEILLQDFIKANLEDGFSPSVILSFFKGQPTDEQAKEFERKLRTEYSGAAGKKFLINYNDMGSEKGLQVDSISSTDYTDKLDFARKANIEDILTAHQATSRILFGVEQEGGLGGNGQEIEKAYQVFKNVFVKDSRNVIEGAINKLLADAGFPAIEFKDKSNILMAELSDQTRERVLTIDELRSLDNRAPLPDGAGQKLLTINKVDSASANFEADNSDADKYKNGRVLKAEDFDKIKHLGSHRGNFTLLSKQEFETHSHEQFRKVELQFDDDNDIENYLIKTPINGKTLSEIKANIKKELGISITTNDLSDRITALTNANLITSKVTDGNVESAPIISQNPRTVEVLYEYKKRPEVPGDTLLKTSRDFCKQVVDVDRLYTRSEIQKMSEIFGYDVFQHAGGWWFNTATQKAENQCRHYWNKVRVIRKESDQ